MAFATLPDTAPALDWCVALQRAGFAFVEGSAMRAAFAASGALTDWDAFAQSWNDLAVDEYMADHGRYRRRRHAVFTANATGAITQAPHQPHFQSLAYNPLHGDIERWFEPFQSTTALSVSLHTILAWCHTLFASLSPRVNAWHIECHQFRIEATSESAGKPTPEGVHRDGVDWVLVLMIARHNIASGTTTIHDAQRTLVGSFTLAQPFDAALVDDTRIFHGVTPVTPLDPAEPAHRDVLVVTFKAR
jgi:hypothetical protein